MKETPFDKSIQEKLKNNIFQPSESAWERLSNQLDVQEEEQRKKPFFYVKYAVSIACLLTLGIYFFDVSDAKPFKQEIAIKPLKIKLLENKYEPVFEVISMEIATAKNIKNIEKRQKNRIPKKSNITKIHEIATAEKPQKNILEITKKENAFDPIKEVKSTSKNSIQVNSNALLYAVTHSPNEIKTYYAKYNIDRDEVLKIIEKTLKKRNLKMDPKTMLAAVEKEIDADDFQNNFMKSLKKKVNNFAIAFTSRNE